MLISIHTWSVCIEAPRKKDGCVIRSHVLVHSFPLKKYFKKSSSLLRSWGPMSVIVQFQLPDYNEDHGAVGRMQ